MFAKEQQARSEVKAEAGASATLSCEVAQAQTEVTWFKDGKKLSSSSKVRVEASGCSRRLVVQQAGKADAGEYSCEAGGQKLSFRLDVAGGCHCVQGRDTAEHSVAHGFLVCFTAQSLSLLFLYCLLSSENRASFSHTPDGSQQFLSLFTSTAFLVNGSVGLASSGARAVIPQVLGGKAQFFVPVGCECPGPRLRAYSSCCWSMALL